MKNERFCAGKFEKDVTLTVSSSYTRVRDPTIKFGQSQTYDEECRVHRSFSHPPRVVLVYPPTRYSPSPTAAIAWLYRALGFVTPAGISSSFHVPCVVEYRHSSSETSAPVHTLWSAHTSRPPRIPTSPVPLSFNCVLSICCECTGNAKDLQVEWCILHEDKARRRPLPSRDGVVRRAYPLASASAPTLHSLSSTSTARQLHPE